MEDNGHPQLADHPLTDLVDDGSDSRIGGGGALANLGLRLEVYWGDKGVEYGGWHHL